MEKLPKFTQVVITSYTSITPNYGCSCSRTKEGEGSTNTTTLVYNNFLVYAAIPVHVDMPIPSFKMKSRWPLYMVLTDLTKSTWLNLLRNREIDLIFGERFHIAVEDRGGTWLKITALQLAYMLLHFWFHPEIVAHCTVNTFAYRSLSFDTAMAKTEHLPSEILEEKMVIAPCHTSEHVNKICFCFPFLQRAYTEEELNAKLTRRVQKAARRQAKQEELKRLHRAQVVSHSLVVADS